MNEIIIIEKKGIKKTCPRCSHEWVYTGQNPFFCSCPRCKTTIAITSKRKRRDNSI